MQRPARSRVYLGFALLALAAAVTGFFTTFIRPLWQGSFHGYALVYAHGAFVFGWLLLFATQAWLVHSKRIPLHRKLGWAGLAIGSGLIATTMAMGVHAMRRDLAADAGEIGVSALLGSFTSPMIFAALFIGGVVYRRKPDVHKRLMLLATLAILWPAFFRFRHYFPGVSRPDIWFGFVLAQAPVLLAMLHDKLSFGRVHRVYRTVGVIFIAEAATEVALFDSPGWRVVAHWLAAPFLP
ncbi:MAG: hypothetical protein ABI588_02620 [Arenimonas sp.]